MESSGHGGEWAGKTHRWTSTRETQRGPEEGTEQRDSVWGQTRCFVLQVLITRNDSALIVPVVQQLRRRTAGLLQSLDNGLVGLYADLSLGPRRLVRCAGQIRLGLLQVGLGSLKIETNKKNNNNKPQEEKATTKKHVSEKAGGWGLGSKLWLMILFLQRKNTQSQASKAALSSS